MWRVDSAGSLWHAVAMHSPSADLDKLLRVRTLAAEVMGLCEELGHPLASNYVHMGLSLLEEKVEPTRVREVPTDLDFPGDD